MRRRRLLLFWKNYDAKTCFALATAIGHRHLLESLIAPSALRLWKDQRYRRVVNQYGKLSERSENRCFARWDAVRSCQVRRIKTRPRHKWTEQWQSSLVGLHLGHISSEMERVCCSLGGDIRLIRVANRSPFLLKMRVIIGLSVVPHCRIASLTHRKWGLEVIKVAIVINSLAGECLVTSVSSR